VKVAPRIEFDDGQLRAARYAKRLEWFSIVYLLTAIVLVAIVLGSSQAMKAAWIEDILSLFPPIAFLVAMRYRDRAPNRRFAWGYHRSISVAYLVSAVALLTLGAYILLDSLMKLVTFEHPTIGMMEIFDWQVWQGWPMLAVLLYTGVPPVILGRMKQKPAEQIHDKVLYADAEMNRADWMTAGAAALGVLGIGLGLWWADSVAALIICVDIVRDGARHVAAATSDLMDTRPRRYDDRRPHPLRDTAREEVERTPWVREGLIRLREEGHVFAGEVIVVPADEDDLVDRVEALTERLRDLDWRLHDIVVVPVREIEIPEGADMEIFAGAAGEPSAATA
jgi:divalent metal cation (Fe/Co/Zn/Cd) transporter